MRLTTALATATPVALLCACLLPAFGCSGTPDGPRPDEAFGVAVVDDAAVVEFYERASYFYERLRKRRVNTLATYRDEVLRDYFRTESAFSDYYADLAHSLEEAHFERNRPLALEVLELRVVAPGRAEVDTRIAGENGLPLRWWSTGVERVDHWERIQGRWWIVPSKL